MSANASMNAAEEEEDEAEAESVRREAKAPAMASIAIRQVCAVTAVSAAAASTALPTDDDDDDEDDDTDEDEDIESADAEPEADETATLCSIISTRRGSSATKCTESRFGMRAASVDTFSCSSCTALRRTWKEAAKTSSHVKIHHENKHASPEKKRCE